MPKIAIKNTNLKVKVKAGEMSAKDALRIMQKRVSWPQVKDSRTGRWMTDKAAK